MYTAFRLAPLVVLATTLSQPAWSADARSIALGGSSIANAQGAHGAVENPASMIAMKRAGEHTHFRLGYSFSIHSRGSAIETLTDDANTNLVNDIEDQINDLTGRQLLCDPQFGNANDVCVQDTQTLADLASQLLNVANDLGSDPLAIQTSIELGMAFTQKKYPFAISLIPTVTISANPNVQESDKDYISEFATLLDNNTLTVEEIRGSEYFNADQLGIPLVVQQPEDVLLSDGRIGAVLRMQLAIGMASEVEIRGRRFDAGVTPKFSHLTAYSAFSNAATEFSDTESTFETRLEESEVSSSSVTFDLGASFTQTDSPVRISTVIRNVIPESIRMEDGFEFKTTPQLIIGAALHKENLSFTGDIALNKAKLDNFESQKMGVGVEYKRNALVLRGGINHDTARNEEATALSFGFGLGPLQFGTRISSEYNSESSIQLSHSF